MTNCSSLHKFLSGVGGLDCLRLAGKGRIVVLFITSNHIAFCLFCRNYIEFSNTPHCVPIKKNVRFLCFEYFSLKSATFYNVCCTHKVETFNSFCNCAHLKFSCYIICGITIGYLRRIQFLRETVVI